MTNYSKYSEIMEMIKQGKPQSEIVDTLNCSYGTIQRAKKWDKSGRKTVKKNIPVRLTENIGNDEFTLVSTESLKVLLKMLKKQYKNEILDDLYQAHIKNLELSMKNSGI